MEDILQALTTDLRTALLLVGGVLVLVIVLWEVIQRRQAAKADSTHLRGPLGQDRAAATNELSQVDPLLEPTRRESAEERLEPTLTLPEIHVRDRLVEPPLVDLDDAMSMRDRGNSIPIMQAERREEDAAAVDERPAAADERSRYARRPLWRCPKIRSRSSSRYASWRARVSV
jgi:hypothetical protein